MKFWNTFKYFIILIVSTYYIIVRQLDNKLFNPRPVFTKTKVTAEEQQIDNHALQVTFSLNGVDRAVTLTSEFLCYG